MKKHKSEYHRTLSPLRYPGAKNYLAPVIESLLLQNRLAACTFVEPFAGSAAVSLYLLKRGVAHRSILIEKDPLIFSLWKCILNSPDELCDRIASRKISLASWLRYQRYLKVEAPTPQNLTEAGYAGLFLNRVNYSGVLNAGPIGGKKQNSNYSIDCRFNRESLIQRIGEISKMRERIEVYFGDSIEVLRQIRERLASDPLSVAYYDPPYFEHGKKYYRHSFEAKDHRRLALHINAAPWHRVISYDDHPEIKKLYAGFTQLSLNWNYSARVARVGKELLISSLANPPEVLPSNRIGWKLDDRRTDVFYGHSSIDEASRFRM